MCSLIRATVLTGILCALPALLFAQCLEDGGLLRSSTNCLGMPTIDKFFDPSTFTWKGKDYLLVNDGNELEIWDVTDPASPAARGQSNFNVDNMGDSDYDLLNYSVCDDCRYGIGVWKLGQVIWDWGQGPAPTWTARRFYGTSRDPRGAFTYGDGGTQYLVANYLPGDMGGDGTVYRLDSPTSLTPIHQIEVPGTIKVANGVRLSQHMYLGLTDNYLYTYVLSGAQGLVFVNKTSIRGSMLRGKGIALKGDRLASAWMDGLKLWNVSNPTAPALIWTLAGDYRYTALTQNFLWSASAGGVKSSYHLPEGREPVRIDQEFWDNLPAYSGCDTDTGATFAPRANWLWMTRYATVQKIDFGRCPPPEVIFADGFESGGTGGWGHE